MKILIVTAALAAAFTVHSDRPLPVLGDHTWTVDTVHSSVVFKVKHAGASWFYGTFAGVSGTFTLDPDHAADGTVAIEIAAASVATRDDKRDEHLRGPDFLDAKQFPAIQFASKKIAKDGDAYAVTGDLTMRGETRPLTLRVQKTGEGEFYGKRIGYETTFTVKRSDFGMDYGVADKVLGDEVTLMIAIEGVQAAAK